MVGNIEYYWRTGNTASETPVGTQIYTGALLAGSGYSAQLFAAAGADRDWNSLKPANGITTFRTGAAAGLVAAVVATLTEVPKDAPVATVQMRVWDNQGGTITSWQQAEYLSPFSLSKPFNVYNIGGDLNIPPSLLGLQSFNMGWYILPRLVPEPSAATIGLVAGVLVIVGRRFRSRQPLDT